MGLKRVNFFLYFEVERLSFAGFGGFRAELSMSELGENCCEVAFSRERAKDQELLSHRSTVTIPSSLHKCRAVPALFSHGSRDGFGTSTFHSKIDGQPIA
jgi:hypothetical protein